MNDNTFPGFDTSDIDIDEDSIEEELHELCAPVFDYKAAQTVINPIGQAVIGDAVDAYQFWVAKCLQTERFKYRAYSSDFGVEIEEIIQADYPRDIAESEIQRTITEALQVDDRTVNVDEFEFEWSGDSLSIIFVVTSIYDEQVYEYRRGGEGDVWAGVKAA